MFSAYNDGKSVVAERFVETLKNKIYKNITDVYFLMLNSFVGKYNNVYHKNIKIKPIDVKFNSYAECNVGSNAIDPKFKIGNHVRI